MLQKQDSPNALLYLVLEGIFGSFISIAHRWLYVSWGIGRIWLQYTFPKRTRMAPSVSERGKFKSKSLRKKYATGFGAFVDYLGSPAAVFRLRAYFAFVGLNDAILMTRGTFLQQRERFYHPIFLLRSNDSMCIPALVISNLHVVELAAKHAKKKERKKWRPAGREVRFLDIVWFGSFFFLSLPLFRPPLAKTPRQNRFQYSSKM